MGSPHGKASSHQFCLGICAMLMAMTQTRRDQSFIANRLFLLHIAILEFEVSNVAFA